MCVCLFSALSCRVGALQISIIIIKTRFNCMACGIVKSAVVVRYGVNVYRPVLLLVVAAGGIFWNNLPYSL